MQFIRGETKKMSKHHRCIVNAVDFTTDDHLVDRANVTLELVNKIVHGKKILHAFFPRAELIRCIRGELQGDFRGLYDVFVQTNEGKLNSLILVDDKNPHGGYISEYQKMIKARQENRDCIEGVPECSEQRFLGQ